MRITIFGYCWLLMLLFAFVNKNAKYIAFMTLFSMIFQSASVVVLRGEGVGPQIFSSFAMVAWNLRMISRKLTIVRQRGTIYKGISMTAALLLAVIIVISRRINYLDYRMQPLIFWMLFAQLFIYISCFLSCWNVYKWLDGEEIHKIMIIIITFVVIVGLIQFMVTSGILPRNNLLSTFIYTADTDSAYYWSTYYRRIFSTYMEPSYCSAFLVGAFYYVISREAPKERELILALLLLLEIILTFSSTGYGTFFLCGIMYLIFSKNKKYLWLLLPVGIAALLFLGVSGELYNIMYRVILNKANTGSGVTRANADYRAFQSFLQSKTWGVGYKNIRGSAFFQSLAGQLGIMGIIQWLMSWIPEVIVAWKNRKNGFLVSATLFLVATIFSLLIAVPDLDFCVFWNAMYLLAMVFGIFFHKGVNLNKDSALEMD